MQKWDLNHEYVFEDKKKSIEQQLLYESRYKEQISSWDLEKKNKQKVKISELSNANGISAAEVKKTEEYKKWNADLSEKYKEKVENLREELSEKYFESKQTKLPDYPIFMAIAEDIGYDATGKPTGNNELVEIGKELKKFIENL